MRDLHPDRYIGHHPDQTAEISRNSAILNRAFEILSHPIKSLEYIVAEWNLVHDPETIAGLIELNQRVFNILSMQNDGWSDDGDGGTIQDGGDGTQAMGLDRVDGDGSGDIGRIAAIDSLVYELTQEIGVLLQNAEAKIVSQNWQDAAHLFMRIKSIQTVLLKLGATV